ncbi:MAG: cyclic nucleotide-binding domain-containing protein [Lachnospiraceae bacterium]|nr:cyclic nucleotide-binding domain-containing protein [Lachnospiraceae bacterium]
MSERINERYIAEFFGIENSEEGAAELAEITARLTRMVFKNNVDICTVDGDPDGMFFIESGSALVLDRDGKQLNVLHVGQYFGEYAVLSGQKRLSTVRSLGRTVVYKMESADLQGFLSRHPEIYGEFMKRVYAQVSRKHSQILALTNTRRGILTHPSNELPLSARQLLIQYGTLFLIYVAAVLWAPAETSAPVFLFPLAVMLLHVLITKRTLESLVVSGILAAILVYRTGIFTGYADSLIDTIGQRDNVFTILVMALMGGMINLIVYSGGVTAFEKTAARFSRTPRGIFLTSLGIMAVTSIDDNLNMLTGSYASYKPAKDKGVVREKLALFYTLLPTVLSSFFPLSLWAIFVTGILSSTLRINATPLFVASIPFNFFSLITLAAMILLALGRLPMNRQLREAEERFEKTGALWPRGSEKYLSSHDTEVWGKKTNVLLPILVMAVASLAIRSVLTKSFVTDSAVGLLVALAFMFLLYCFRGVMTPEQFMEHLVAGIAESALPIILYLLTINFSTLLDMLGLHVYLAGMIDIFRQAAFLLPAAAFLLSMLLTIVLGSSWSMYAIMFPIVLGIAGHLGIPAALMTGAIAGAGIAGEKNCAFTAEALNVGTAVGIDPNAVRKIRIFYSAVLTAITTAAYLIAGVVV